MLMKIPPWNKKKRRVYQQRRNKKKMRMKMEKCAHAAAVNAAIAQRNFINSAVARWLAVL